MRRGLPYKVRNLSPVHVLELSTDAELPHAVQIPTELGRFLTIYLLPTIVYLLRLDLDYLPRERIPTRYRVRRAQYDTPPKSPHITLGACLEIERLLKGDKQTK